MKLINNSGQTITSGTDRFRQVLSFNSTAKKKLVLFLLVFCCLWCEVHLCVCVCWRASFLQELSDDKTNR